MKIHLTYFVNALFYTRMYDINMEENILLLPLLCKAYLCIFILIIYRAGLRVLVIAG